MNARALALGLCLAIVVLSAPVAVLSPASTAAAGDCVSTSPLVGQYVCCPYNHQYRLDDTVDCVS